MEKGDSSIVMKTFAQSALATCLLMSTSGLPALAESVVIEGRSSCGTGCSSSYEQLGPVTRTRYGYPRVPVAVKTTGFERGGGGSKIDKFWIVADCQGKRLGSQARDSDGADAYWSRAYTSPGQPNNYGRTYEQWRLLCRAAGEL